MNGMNQPSVFQRLVYIGTVRTPYILTNTKERGNSDALEGRLSKKGQLNMEALKQKIKIKKEIRL